VAVLAVAALAISVGGGGGAWPQLRAGLSSRARASLGECEK
jgi:hypothetical protein